MKFNSVVNDNERKSKILIDKSTELTRLKEEVEILRDKAKERDAFSNKNKELLAKYYG